MKHSATISTSVCAGALLLGGGVGGYYGARAATSAAPRTGAVGLDEAGSGAIAPATEREPRELTWPSAPLPAEPLAWSELLEPGAALVPSAKTTALAGHRVRLVGFMAQMELPIPGAFYLVPQPLDCDEAGGGTADLMPTSVLVLSESVRGQVVPHVPGALEVTGVLEVGNRPGPDGRASAFRLRLDSGATGGVRAPRADDSPSSISG